MKYVKYIWNLERGGVDVDGESHNRPACLGVALSCQRLRNCSIRIYIWAVNTWEFVFEFWSFDLMNNYNIFELSAPEKSFMIFCCLIWWQNGIHLKKVGSAADMPNKNINLRIHTWKSVGMLPSRGSLWDILESSWMVTLGLGHMSTHLRSKDSHTGKQKSE